MSSALLAIARDRGDDRALSERICLAYLDGMDIDGAAISLSAGNGAWETLWASDAIAELLEDLQATLNEGAGLDAARTGAAVAVADIRVDGWAERWPLYAAAVTEQTWVAAVLALPLRWGAIELGVLGLYRISPGEVARDQWRDALEAADVASLMLLSVHTEPDSDKVGVWLDHSLGGRPEIHQATGMVLAQLGISATDALARLRAYAFAEDRLLIDVARDVVARRLSFASD